MLRGFFLELVFYVLVLAVVTSVTSSAVVDLREKQNVVFSHRTDWLSGNALAIRSCSVRMVTGIQVCSPDMSGYLHYVTTALFKLFSFCYSSVPPFDSV